MKPSLHPASHARRLLRCALLLPMLACLLVVRPGTAQPSTTEQTPAVTPPRDPRADQIIAYCLIGGSSSHPEHRGIGWNIRTQGWHQFVRRQAEPAIRWGVRRIQLHNPFGVLAGEPMQFDQYIHARNAGLAWIYKDFVEAWKPITEQGVEVIAYLGKLEGDPDFDQLLAEGRTDAWLARAWLSVQAPLNAGMSIGLDSASTAGPDSPTYRFTELLRSLGVRVYIEPRPPKQNDHWFDYPIITTDAFWKRSDPERHPADSGRWAARNDLLTGEIVRIVNGSPPEGESWDELGWLVEKIRAATADGHAAAVPVHLMLRHRIPLEDLLPPIPGEASE